MQHPEKATLVHLIGSGLVLALGTTALGAPNAEPDRTLMVVEASIDRTVFQTSRASSDMQLCISNTNPLSDRARGLLPDDRFLFALPPGCGAFGSGCDVTIARSTARDPLSPADFTCAISPGTIELTHVGPPRSFLPDDAVCLDVEFTSAMPTHCALHFRFEPRVAALPPHQPFGVHRVAASTKPSFFTLDVVDPLSGPTGARGPRGDPGALGPVGPQGLIGARGVNGSQGIGGSTGPLGPQGVQGTAGPWGDSGAEGSTGIVGSVGAEGPAGSAGPDGATGLAGADGATGSRGPQGQSGPTAGADAPCRRFYYLTRMLWDGSQATGACDSGFHMAARAELGVGPRHGPVGAGSEAGRGFIYDTGRGFQLDDSGYGPPGIPSTAAAVMLEFFGWIRTGGVLISGPDEAANCWGWTSASPDSYGAAFGFQAGNWPLTCDTPRRVWCIED